jgi:hypothetical protein
MNGGAGYGCVSCGGVQTAMPEQCLDDADIGSGFEQVSCETVPQHARVYGFGDACSLASTSNDLMDAFSGERPAGNPSWKEVARLPQLEGYKSCKSFIFNKGL